MNYELTKQLKDAGFPQRTNTPHYNQDGSGVWRTEFEDCYIPTLSELIEACKEEFLGFSRIVHTHEAKSGMRYQAKAKKTKTTDHTAYGATPEEAVAKLWLELNKK